MLIILASEAACKDFTDMSIQLEVESKCRVTAESFAARVSIKAINFLFSTFEILFYQNPILREFYVLSILPCLVDNFFKILYVFKYS